MLREGHHAVYSLMCKKVQADFCSCDIDKGGAFRVCLKFGAKILAQGFRGNIAASPASDELISKNGNVPSIVPTMFPCLFCIW